MNQISLPVLFYVMRHGHTDWNDQGLVMGGKDIPLNEKGRRRVYEASQILSGINIGRVTSSPLRRAVETAEILNFDFTVDERLKEADFGDLEGQQKCPEKIAKYKKNKAYQSFKITALSAFDQAPENSLFITHGHVLEALLEDIGLSWADVSGRSTKGRPLKFIKNGLEWRVTYI